MNLMEHNPTEPKGYNIQSLEAGLAVLRLIGQFPDQNVPQLAARVGLTKSKVFRILRTLESLGYVTLADDHTFRLGTAALVLGQQASAQYGLIQAGASVLDELSATLHENVYLMVREQRHGLVVDLRVSTYPIRTFAQVGRIAALHAGGAPKVLLAYAPESVIDAVLEQPLERFTSGTAQNAESLRQVLADIRRDGLHVSVSDLQDQVFAIAAPIFDHQGQVVAALSVAGPLIRFNDEIKERYSRLILAGSRTISERLGGG